MAAVDYVGIMNHFIHTHACMHTHALNHTHTHTHNGFTALLDFVWDYPVKGKTRKVKPIWIYWSKR